ncbi:MAG TPA: response regulator [Pyrinomonadaceae bacterium]
MRQITVLYVEDHDLVLFTVKQLLELEGWRVQICRDGADAGKQLSGEDPFDLIILDAELPSVSGFELIRHARALTHRRTTPIIMFTARDHGDEATAAGAVACLKKPGGIKDLLATCYHVLQLEPGQESEPDGARRAANWGGNTVH